MSTTSKPAIRHPRLDTFYRSSAMSFASIFVCLSLMYAGYTDFHPITTICFTSGFIFMAAYAIWYWTGKPKAIATSSFVSDISTYYVLYFLIWGALKSKSPGWLIFATAVALLTLLIHLYRLRTHRIAQ